MPRVTWWRGGGARVVVDRVVLCRVMRFAWSKPPHIAGRDWGCAAPAPGIEMYNPLARCVVLCRPALEGGGGDLCISVCDGVVCFISE